MSYWFPVVPTHPFPAKTVAGVCKAAGVSEGRSRKVLAGVTLAVKGMLSIHFSKVRRGWVSDSLASFMASSAVGELVALVGRGRI